MALRIRRGTEAQLQLITPVEGELIYTTDSKDLYVGDGTTVGGVKVGGDIPTSINDLNDVNLSGISVGQVLKWNGSSFVPGDDDTVVGTSEGVIEGSNYKINVVADDSTVLVDITSKQINGLIVGNIYDDFSDTVVIDPISRLSKLDIISDSDVLILSHNSVDLYNAAGSQLIDGDNKVFYGDLDGNVRGSLINQSLTKILVNHVTETLQGTLLGDVVGSVFADDSTKIIDGITGDISTKNIYSSSGIVRFNSDFQTILIAESIDSQSNLVLKRKSDSDLSLSDLNTGTIFWEQEDSVQSLVYARIQGRPSGLRLQSDASGNFSELNSVFISSNGNIGIGTFTPADKLEIKGSVTAAAFKGSLVSDDSTTIIDAIDGTIIAKGFIQFGSYTDIEIADITPTNGMVYYNTTNNKFRGYANGVWVDLH